MESRTCSKCDRYSFPLSRCLDGKVSPRSIKSGVEMVEIFGLDYICPYSKLWNKIYSKVKR